MKRITLLWQLLLIPLGVLLPSFAFAHTGIGVAGGFMHGYLHPFSGLDYVCAMLAVGLWAVQLGGRSVWAVPLTFVGVMALGGALPVSGISLPFVEQGIALCGVYLAVV
ncbi:MAG TPA: HupE/UreJ family protein [Gallionella sp.]